MTEPAPSTSSKINTEGYHRQPHRRQQQSEQKKQNLKNEGKGRGGKHSTKLRGRENDGIDVRLSKTLSWILRHGALSEGIAMREDGFVKVDVIMKNDRIQPLGLTLDKLKGIVQADPKQRFSLILEQADGTRIGQVGDGGGVGTMDNGIWWIKANQGHSMSAVKVEMKPILRVEDIPSKLAIHGTTNHAWNTIRREGLSKMKRNHIHLAQGVGGDNVTSGMRKSSQILIFINVQKALDAGIKFELSDNGVVLTAGDENGYLKPEFFDRAEDARGRSLEVWEGSRTTNHGLGER